MSPPSTPKSESMAFKTIITKTEALQHPEADGMRNLHISQVSDADLRPLMIKLLTSGIGISGVNYGTKDKPILAELQSVAPSGEAQ